MKKITGYESSVLCFLAQRPEYFSKFAHTLGSLSFETAEYICSKKTNISEDARLTGDYVIQWARERQEREQRDLSC